MGRKREKDRRELKEEFSLLGQEGKFFSNPTGIVSLSSILTILILILKCSSGCIFGFKSGRDIFRSQDCAREILELRNNEFSDRSVSAKCHSIKYSSFPEMF